jgi:RNA polymerase sigma-70 factor (ECF subfamily)
MADAQDLTQAFFAKVLRGNFFAGAQSDDGRMRTYLLTAFTRHMADEWDKSQAKKRGGGLEILSLDFDERTFERAWARSVLEQAGAQLEMECISAGKAELFAALSPLITGDGEASAYEAISARTNISSDSLRQNVRRLRLRFRELLRVVIADTLTEPTEEQIQAELLALRAALTA